jgi:23S rRNA pseudouridine2605 synthase
VEQKTEIIRLNKYVASSGICTRKEAVEIIKKGLVTVNESICYEPFYEIKNNDVISYQGKLITPKKHYTYLLLNKPKNVGEILGETQRVTISSLIKNKTTASLKQLFPISAETSGLTILTDDEDLIRKCSSYDIKYDSVFEIHTTAPVDSEEITRVLTFDQEKAYFIKGLSHIPDMEKNILGVKMSGGSEERLRAFFSEKALNIVKCDRTFIKGMTKKDLKRGWSRILTEKEIIFLKYF